MIAGTVAALALGLAWAAPSALGAPGGGPDRVVGILPRSTQPTATAPVFFLDVTGTTAAYSEIMWATTHAVLSARGTGIFAPAAALRRDELAVGLYAIAGSPAYTPPATSPFRDVGTSNPAYRAISWVVSKKIVDPAADALFHPALDVTRDQLASFLYRLAGGTATRLTPKTAGKRRQQVSWTAVDRVWSGSYTSGRGLLGQPRAVSRADFALFGYRAAGSPAYVAPLHPGRPSAIMPVPQGEWNQIVATGTWRPGCYGGYGNFVRVEVPYYGMSDHLPHRGAIVVNRDISRSTAAAFDYLYAKRFPLYSVIPVENFGGWDRLSENANNSSGFNCRKPAEIMGSLQYDSHATGRALDFNPVQNPWIRPGTYVWEPAAGAYWASRRSIAYEPYGVIASGGVVTSWFLPRRWRWGASGTIDLMHFDTWYPSVFRPGY